MAGKVASNPNPTKINNAWGPGVDKKTKEQENIRFLAKNPSFDEKPATIAEFLGPGYLDIDPVQNNSLPKGVGIRAGVKQALIDIFGEEIDPEQISVTRRAMFTGGIGIGKTTMAAVALSYMVHWVSCLRDPQAYFGLLPGTRIAFMLMSTREKQAREVLFGDIKARINASEWFRKNCNYDPKLKNQLEFPKGIMVVPGNSAETTFEGYNILAGILDEGDSHKITEEKDYAEEGWNTIHSRIQSRFSGKDDDHRGLLIAVGQMKSATGFMDKKMRQLENDAHAVVVNMTLWDSMGWDYYRDSNGNTPVFYYDKMRRIVIPAGPATLLQGPDPTGNIIKIPMAFFKDFENNPVKALRDHAGIPPQVDDPFIATIDRVNEAQEKWAERFSDLKYTVTSDSRNPTFHPDFCAVESFKRVIHVDIGYSPAGDALGMAMAHIPEMVEIDGELKPYIVFDFLLRIKASGGKALTLAEFRQIIYHLRDELNFKISLVSFDGFQSQDSIQILRKRRINTAEVSVDRNKGPYEDLREAIYERRIEFPSYMTYLKKSDPNKVDIAKKELLELQDTGKKIDHPPKGGSKDVADAMAGCVYNLSGNTAFRRGARKPGRNASDVDNIDDYFVNEGKFEKDIFNIMESTVVAEKTDQYEKTESGLYRPAGLPEMTVPAFIKTLKGDNSE